MAIRDVAATLDVADASGPWSDALAWSNLYKVAPESGNPGSRLCTSQLDGCRDLIEREVADLAPSRVLMFTGWGWARDFLEPLPLEEDAPPTGSYVEWTGDGLGARWVVCRHPQGVARDPLVEEVVRAFRG